MVPAKIKLNTMMHAMITYKIIIANFLSSCFFNIELMSAEFLNSVAKLRDFHEHIMLDEGESAEARENDTHVKIEGQHTHLRIFGDEGCGERGRVP